MKFSVLPKIAQLVSDGARSLMASFQSLSLAEAVFKERFVLALLLDQRPMVLLDGSSHTMSF